MSDTSNTVNEDREAENDRPPRSRVRLAFIIALWLVIILLLVAIFSPVRDVVINRFLTTAPTPTPTIVAGGNQFYIQAYPQGTITIDGQAVTSLPNEYNKEPPLTLSRGEHKIEWQSPPFLPLTCIVSVPPMLNEPCNYESLGDIANAPSLRVISFNASITNLSTAQQTALKQSIQDTLNTLQSTDTLQTGEQYVYAQPSGETIVKTATQPLNATLSLHLDTNPTSSNSCSPNGDFCTMSGQNCLQICSDGETISSHGVFTWNIIALYYPTWTYTTQSGQVVARNQPDTNSSAVGMDHSIDLGATWNGKAWKVGLVTYNNVLFKSSNIPPPACAAMHNLNNSFGDNTALPAPFGETQGANPKNVDWGYVVDSNEAQGCLGVVVLSQDTTATPTNFKQPPAYFLYRFGVLLAVNALAHSEFPSVPLADAYEQSIAQQIAAHYKV
ncbi:MAG: hypothetical protein ACYDER_06585 [Ktedonobacteraceae bacterium]